MELGALIERWGIRILVALVLLGAIIGGAVVATRKSAPPRPGGVVVALGKGDARAPAGARVRVEVLNASRVIGLARRATLYLRDRGFDVVESGNAAGARRDTTLVLDRSGHDAWAASVAQAMGGAPIVTRPDTLHDVDVTVLVGAAWRPPAQPFYP